MTAADKMFNSAIENWRISKGIGTALIPYPLNDKCMVLGILQRMYNKSSTLKTIIITNNFNDRREIIDFLTNQLGQDENNKEFKQYIDDERIKVITDKYIPIHNFTSYPNLCIVYHLKDLNDYVEDFIIKCKFKLVVLNRLLLDGKSANKLFKLSPIIDAFKIEDVNKLRISSPVEEHRIPITINQDSEHYKLLEQYTEYINTSLSIFGSFDVMQQAHFGNNQLNISSMQICNKIAVENGWSDKLDMSIEFNRQIDDLYNPGNLRDRAINTYEIIRNRNQLLSDFEGKLEEIYNIVKNNIDKKILIISKRAEFASKITDYLNLLFNDIVCFNFHDKVENIPEIDDNGNPITIKSGPNKGKPKVMGAKRQKTYAVEKFNNDKIIALSTNNAPDKSLAIDVDIIIITSPMCEELKSYIYRLSDVNFRGLKIVLYSLYCRNTAEQRTLENKCLLPNQIVKNDGGDEIYSDFVVVE